MVIEAVWQAMLRFGLQPGAQILEPSMGVGHFFGLMPESCCPAAADRRRTRRHHGADRKMLYPDSTIFAKGFEETALPDNFFDAVIGNIPFGNYPVHDPAYRRTPFTRAIHDYFFAKSLDKLRPAASWRSSPAATRWTSRTPDPALSGRPRGSPRRDPPAQHRLQGQCRNRSHDRHSVPAKARARPAASSGEAWQDLAAIDTPDGAIFVNEYFARHPGDDAGRDALEARCTAPASRRSRAISLPSALRGAVAALPEGIYSRGTKARPPAARPSLTDPRPRRRQGRRFCRTRRRHRRAQRRHFRDRSKCRVRPPRVPRHARGARCRPLVFKTQLDDAPEERITEARRC
jgi:hypothetical protein